MPLYLLIQRDFHFQSVGKATLLLTVLMVACFGPSYPIGVLADRGNRKTLLSLGLALNGLGFMALAYAPSYGLALTAVAVAGFGGSFYHPAATAMVSKLFPGQTGKALGLVGIGAGVGFFLGPVYAGWRAAQLEPVLGAAAWRVPVRELGIAGVLMALAFAWLAQAEQRTDTHLQRKQVPLFPAPSLWGWFAGYCFAFSLRDFAGASMASLGSLFVQNVHGFNPKATGLALSGIFVASIVSNPLFGSLSDRGRKRWIALTILVAATMIALFPNVPAAWTVPVYIIYGFFFMASYPMTEAALMESVPDAVRGRVFGLFVMTGGVIGNLSHWAVGAKSRSLGAAVHNASSYFLIYLGLSLLLAISLIGLLCVDPIRRREGKQPVLAESDSTPLLT